MVNTGKQACTLTLRILVLKFSPELADNKYEYGEGRPIPMRDPFSPIVINLNKAHRANDPPLVLADDTSTKTSQEEFRSYQTEGWQMAVGRFGACRNLAGDRSVTIFKTSPRTPVLYHLGDESVFHKELNLHRHRLPQGIYRAVELEILCFITTITVNNWAATGNKTTTVPMKIFVSRVPELCIRRGDLLFQVDGKDYWLSPDWKTLFRRRPEKPLSAILLPEGCQFVPSQKNPAYQIEMLPGERFQIRLALPGMIIVQKQRRTSRRNTACPGHLRICK